MFSSFDLGKRREIENQQLTCCLKKQFTTYIYLVCVTVDIGSEDIFIKTPSNVSLFVTTRNIWETNPACHERRIVNASVQYTLYTAVTNIQYSYELCNVQNAAVTAYSAGSRVTGYIHRLTSGNTCRQIQYSNDQRVLL